MKLNDRIKSWLTNLSQNIQKNPYTYGFWSIIILLIIPIITWLLYYIGDCGYIFIETSLTVGDALGFYGSFLAFLGTVALGALALWQNKQISKIQNDTTIANIQTPVFIIESINYNDKHLEHMDNQYKKEFAVKEPQRLHFEIKNIGEGVAFNVCHSGDYKNIKNYYHNLNACVDKSGTINIDIHLDSLPYGINHNIDINYENILGYKYKQTVTYKIEKLISNNHNAILYIELISPQKRLGYKTQQEKCCKKKH